MANLKIDALRYETLLSGATKKLKNESVHGGFFYEKKVVNKEN